MQSNKSKYEVLKYWPMIGPLWEGATNNNNVEPPSFGGATSSFYDVDAVLIHSQISQRIKPFYFLFIFA